MSDEHELNRTDYSFKPVTDNRRHIEDRLALDEAMRDMPTFTFPARPIESPFDVCECGVRRVDHKTGEATHDPLYSKGRAPCYFFRLKK